jgi:hypothetical protein
MSFSISVNDEFLNLEKKEFIGISFEEFDLGALETRTNSSSNDFKIPNTAYNRRVLGYAPVDNIASSTYTPWNVIPARIFQNNIQIDAGVIQVNKTDKDSIDITFYGSGIDLFNLLKGRKLRDIDLSDYRHIYNATNVINSFSNTSGYIYLPIDYGLFTDRSSLSISSGEIYPAVYISTLMERMLRDIGWKVDGSLLNRALYKKSVIPFINETFGFSEGFVQEKSYYVYNPSFTIAPSTTIKFNFTNTLSEFSGVTYGNELFNLTTDRYTADENYEITLFFGFNYQKFFTDNPGVGATPRLSIKKNGAIVAGPVTAAGIQHTLTLSTSDYIELEITNQDPSNSIRVYGSSHGEVSGEFQAGSQIFFETVLPDIEQIDFLKWVLVRFLGVLKVDNYSKTVYLNHFDDIRNNDVDDWSNKVDISRGIETDYTKVVSSYARNNYLKYTIDENDYYQTVYNSNNAVPFGSGLFALDNDFLENEKTLFETKFSGTFLIDSFDTHNVKLPYIPRHINPDDATEINIAEPRVLTVYGTIPLIQFSATTTMTILGTSVSSVPFAYFYKPTLGFSVDDFKESLAFGAQNIFAPNDLGALETDYASLLGILQTPNSKTAYMKLNQIDIANLDFSKRKYIERFGGYFYLNRIEDYDGSGDSAKCELVKLT